jgi:long-chain acyl-CoA synthetase
MAVTRVFDILTQLQEKYNKPNILAAKEKGQWRAYSTQEFAENVNFLSYGLYNLGIKPGDKIAIIANNRPEWNFTDYAIQQVGAISVPIYPTISETDLSFILNDAGVTYLFISTAELYAKLKPTIEKISSIKDVYAFNSFPGCKNWNELLEAGRKTPRPVEIENIKKAIEPDDLLTILYTSGTTGTPKGVMLSHNNLISNSMASQTLCPFEIHWKALSFLPLNHVYERMLTTLYLYLGISIYYAESMDTIIDNLKEVKPQVFSTVPRLLEKVYDRIVAKGNEQTGIKKKLFFWALELGLKYELHGANGWWYELKLKIARKLIFSKWKEALGGNVRAIVSGGAALQPRLSRVFFAAGINVLEGYGLTETSPVIAVNNFLPDSICFGTVGPVIDKVNVKFAEDGEILVKGPNVMLGYYKRPDATAEAIDADGWFHTGDIGMFVDNRFLKITDRKKEIFKTSGGKYITPVMLENKLKESPFIEQVMVIGENQKFASALIVPAFAYLKDYCKRKNIDYTSNEDIVKNEVIRKRILEEVETLNKELAQYEKIKSPELLSREWSIEKNEMTPKLSLKRKIILAENKELIDKIYREKNPNNNG